MLTQDVVATQCQPLEFINHPEHAMHAAAVICSYAAQEPVAGQ